MSGEREVDRGDFLLTDDDRANGFSIVTDDRHNTTMLKQGKPVAWFSAAVNGEVLRVFLGLVKDCERRAKGGSPSRGRPCRDESEGAKARVRDRKIMDHLLRRSEQAKV